jgi:hypothetical protein
LLLGQPTAKADQADVLGREFSFIFRHAKYLLKQNLEWAEEKRLRAKQVAHLQDRSIISHYKFSLRPSTFRPCNAIGKIIKTTEPGSTASRWLSYHFLAHEKNHYLSHTRKHTTINLTGATPHESNKSSLFQKRKQHAIDSIEAIAIAAETLKRHLLSVTKKNLPRTSFRTCEHARN